MKQHIDGKTRKIAEKQAIRWRNNPYYNEAESKMGEQWRKVIYPIIRENDFSTTLDLAAGHGRNSQYLLPLSKVLYIVDIHQENIDFCRKRFGDNPKIKYLVNNGYDLRGINSNSTTFVYCFDAMVHFHSDVIRSYLREFYRILLPGGAGFCHHSNSANDPGGLNISRHIRGRNFMTREMFMHYCILEGFEIISSNAIDWGGESQLDCFTSFKKLG